MVSQASSRLDEGVKTLRDEGTTRRESGPQRQEEFDGVGEAM